jgi:hypothetical protein
VETWSLSTTAPATSRSIRHPCSTFVFQRMYGSCGLGQGLSQEVPGSYFPTPSLDLTPLPFLQDKTIAVSESVLRFRRT